MNFLKRLGVLSATTGLLLFTLSGCAVQVKNLRWYGDIGPDGAVWFETLSQASGTVDKDSWDRMRVGMACGPLDNIKEIKKEIEQACSATACDYEKVEQVMGKLLSNLESIQ